MVITTWIIVLGIGLVILLLWLMICIVLSLQERNSSDLYDLASDEGDELPEALHETCNTRCGEGRVCESGVCKQEVNQPCAQNVDCAYGNSCVNWICGGEAADSIEQESESDSEVMDMSPRSSRRITFIDES